MKRYFITLMTVLFLCLGFSSQAEAKTLVIKGEGSATIKLGTTKMLVDSNALFNLYFFVPRDGYYTFSLNSSKLAFMSFSSRLCYEYDLGGLNTDKRFNDDTMTVHLFKGDVVIAHPSAAGYYTDNISCSLTIKYSKSKVNKNFKNHKFYKVTTENVAYSGNIPGVNNNCVLGLNIVTGDKIYFKAPTTAKYKVTAISIPKIDFATQLRVFGGGTLGWDIVQGNGFKPDGPLTCELEKGQKLEFAADGLFKVRITKIAENKGKETVETGERISLKTGDKGKTVWKISNGNAKVVKTSSKSAQIEGVKKGKAKVTAKVNGCTYTWTITVKKSEKQINEELHANISTKCYPFKYNPDSMLLWIENAGDSVSLTGTIGLYKDGVEVETIPFSRALIGGQYITVVESNAGVDFDEVKFKEFTVKKSSKSFNDVEPDYGKMTYNKTEGYAIYTVPAVSGANSTFEGYALWISDSGEMLFYGALSAAGTEIKVPMEVVNQLEEEDPTYYCYCWES